MNNIKDAFQKVKEDIDFLKKEIDYLKSNSKETNEIILKINETLKILIQNNEKLNLDKQTDIPTKNDSNKTISTPIPTHNTLFNPLKPKYSSISTGNEGVPTDKQTNRQTDTNSSKFSLKNINNNNNNSEESMDDVLKILNSLDHFKKEIRLKFKRITEQEFLVFSTIYQLDDEVGYTDYKTLSERLNLSESSIRDYVGRLIKKGIPVEKIKVNNKNIQLSISKNLKKIASLQTIYQLRGL